MNDKTTIAIENAIKKAPKAKKTAVENFVWSAPDDRMDNSMNLSMDARAYKWNADTVKAIRSALLELGKI